MQKKQHI